MTAKACHSCRWWQRKDQDTGRCTVVELPSGLMQIVGSGVLYTNHYFYCACFGAGSEKTKITMSPRPSKLM